MTIITMNKQLITIINQMVMETQKVMPMEMIKIINPKLKGKMSSA